MSQLNTHKSLHRSMYANLRPAYRGPAFCQIDCPITFEAELMHSEHNTDDHPPSSPFCAIDPTLTLLPTTSHLPLLAPMGSTEGEEPSEGWSQAQQQPIRQPDNTSSSDRYLTCTYAHCTIRSKTKKQLLAHKQTHKLQRERQAKRIQCVRNNPVIGKPCNWTFRNPNTFTRHEEEIHNKIDPFSCKDCEKTYSRQGALRKHQEIVHSRKREESKE